MKTRDRLALAAVAAVVAVGAMWLLVVSPERGKVSTLKTQIASERAALATAQSKLSSSRDAVAAYVGNVHQVGQVTHAVPTSPAVDEVIKTIAKLAGTHVDWQAFNVGSSSPSTAGPVAIGLTFNFQANYGNLQSFLTAIDSLTTTDGSSVSSNGRLFTIESVSLTPTGNSSTKASIVADVYQQTPITVSSTTGTTP
jgi:hypothetical protein